MQISGAGLPSPKYSRIFVVCTKLREKIGAAPEDGRRKPLSRVDQNHLGILERLDAQQLFAEDRGAVAGVELHLVDLDRALGRHEIGVAGFAEWIIRRLAGLERRTDDARVGADWQRLFVVVKAAGQRHELAGFLRERLGAP